MTDGFVPVNSFPFAVLIHALRLTDRFGLRLVQITACL